MNIEKTQHIVHLFVFFSNQHNDVLLRIQRISHFIFNKIFKFDLPLFRTTITSKHIKNIFNKM